MLKMTGGGDHQIPRREFFAIEVEQRGLLQAAYRFFRSQDRLAERMILPEALDEDLMDEVIRIVFIHLDLLKDHPLFTGDVLVFKERVEYQIADHINRNR